MFHKIDTCFYVRCAHKIKHTLDQCKDGVYYYKFKLKGQKAITRSSEVDYDGTKASHTVAFDIFQKAKLDALARGVYDRPSNKTIVNLLKIGDSYYKSLACYDNVYKCACQWFIDYFKTSIKIDQITTDSIRGLDEFFQESLIKKNTANRYHSILRRCLDLAIKNKDFNLKLNPYVDFKSHSEKKFIRKRIASTQELILLWENFSPLMRDIIDLDVHSGLRRKELLNLQPKNISTLNGGVRYEIFQTKSDEWKSVPFNETAAKIVLRRIKSMPSHAKYIFHDENGNQLKEDGLIRTEFNRVREKLGIKDLQFRDLRKSFGAHLLMMGGSMKALKELLGHASIRTTDSTYTPYTNEYLNTQVNKISLNLGQKRGNSFGKKDDSHVTANFDVFVFSQN